MKDFKETIAKLIKNVIEVDEEEIKKYIETPKDDKNGDYSFTCFKLAKELRKAPMIIANEIKDKVEQEISNCNEIEK